MSLQRAGIESIKVFSAKETRSIGKIELYMIYLVLQFVTSVASKGNLTS